MPDYNPLAFVLDLLEGPPTAMLLFVSQEIDATIEKMKQQFSAFLYGPPREIVKPWRASSSKLYERALRGGRKGRSAIRRLKRRGDWDAVSRHVEWVRR